MTVKKQKNRDIDVITDDSSEYGSIMRIATRNVISAPPTMRIYGAVETLAHWGFRRLPIVDPGTHRLKGILTIPDLINFLGGGEKFNLINVKHAGNFLAAINESVHKIMRQNVCTLPPSASIEDATRIIVKNRIGGIPIVDETGVLIGIVTERDVLRDLAKRISSLTVRDIMSTDLVVASPDQLLSEVTRILNQNRFRRLPIISDHILFGIITATDIMNYLGSGRVFEKLVTGHVDEVVCVPIRELMSKNLFLTHPHITVTEACQEMLEKNVGALPVIEDNHLVGLITEFDMVKLLSKE